MNVCKNVKSQLVGDLRETVQKTAKTERGFNICAKHGKLTAGMKCTGTKCGLHLEGGCPGGRLVGDFHTHPRPSLDDLIGPFLSPQDLRAGEQREFSCIVPMSSPHRLHCMNFGPKNSTAKQKWIKRFDKFIDKHNSLAGQYAQDVYPKLKKFYHETFHGDICEVRI